MPIYSDVVASRLEKYRSQLERDGTNDADIDGAIFRFVFCQLVDAAFGGGGGGGGGSTSSATIASGINQSIDIDTIIARLTDIDTNQLNQSAVRAAIDSSVDLDTIIARLQSIDTKTLDGLAISGAIDGASTMALIANAILSIEGGQLGAADVVAAIQSAADIDTIVTRLTSLDTKALAQSDITAAIQSATDIDTLITQLTSIDSKLQSGYRSAATITRAANTTAYTANDVWGGAFELTNFGSSGGLVILTDVRVTFNITSAPPGMAGFSLYLYSVTPPSAYTDNGAFSYPSGDRGTAGSPIMLTPNGIDLGSAQLALGGGSVVATASNIDQTFKLAPGSTSVFGYLVSRGSYPPASNSETATLETLVVGV